MLPSPVSPPVTTPSHLRTHFLISFTPKKKKPVVVARIDARPDAFVKCCCCGMSSRHARTHARTLPPSGHRGDFSNSTRLIFKRTKRSGSGHSFAAEVCPSAGALGRVCFTRALSRDRRKREFKSKGEEPGDVTGRGAPPPCSRKGDSSSTGRGRGDARSSTPSYFFGKRNVSHSWKQHD